LGSIRCAINSKSEIISAQDFDAWGYKMDGRKFSADESKYKFTSKERDIETDFDYFGARYYDARIGRWEGMEPKQDKYIKYSPYGYVLNNPIKMIDIGGNDGKVIIDNSAKTIEIHVKNYYTQSDKFLFPLSDVKKDRLLGYVNNAQEKWNKAADGKTFSSKDKQYSGYSVKFIVTAEPVNSGSLNWMVSSDPGSNAVFSRSVWKDSEGNKKKTVSAGTNLSDFAIYDFGNKKGEDSPNTGTHEIGHLMGLADDYVEGPNSMRSKSSQYADPTYDDVQTIIDQLDFTQPTQTIKGATKNDKHE
jgi:RHS repeat-associated protein